MKEETTILKFFNVHNVDHLKAFKYLEDHGCWPKGFLPENVECEFERMWSSRLIGKMAEAWIESNLKGKVNEVNKVNEVMR